MPPSWVQSFCSSWTWRWPKCECLLVIFTWLTGLLVTCFRAVCRLGRVSSPILPTVNPRSQSPKRRCARWWNWCRKSKCQCTSPTCRRYRRWKKDWRKFPARCFRKMSNLRWPVWEPDQNSLFTRVIKASRLDGFKMSLKEGMHFTGRVLYVVTYKIFTGVAIYLIFVSSVKIRTHPMMYKDVGKIAMEKIPFAGLDICPSHLFPQQILIEAERLYTKTTQTDAATDLFGDMWNREQAAKLYFYVYKRCQAATSHSRFNGFWHPEQSLQEKKLLKNYNMTFRDDPGDTDFQKILRLVKKLQGTIDCSKILQACRWGPDGQRNCSDIFEMVETETGDCCRLNLIPKNNSSKNGPKWNIDEYAFIENGKEEEMQDSPSFQKVAGSDFGLTFVLIMETENMACPINEGAAYMVYVHSPLDRPNAKTNGIPIAPKHEVYINVNAEITIADKDIFNLLPESRQCYSQKEGQFLNSTDYTEGNCRMECRSLLIQSRCKCQQFGTTNGSNENLCGPRNAECEEKLEAELRAHGYSKMCMNLSTPMNCYRGCTEVVYNTDVTSTPYFGEPALVEQLDLKEGQYTSTVKIFFGSDSFAAKQMQSQYDFWEYVGIVGGLLGMLIGFDFMTLVHLIYAFGIWMKGLCLKRKKSRIAQAIFNMTNHVDLVKALSTQTPSNPIELAGTSTRSSSQPRTWSEEMNKLDARLKSIYVIQSRAENEPIATTESMDVVNLIEPIDSVVPTGPRIRNALFEHTPKKITFKNIFTIPTRVAPADSIELLNIEPAEPNDMEFVDPIVEPVVPSVVAPLEHRDNIELVDTTDLESANPIDTERVIPIDIETIQQLEMETLEVTNIEPIDSTDTERAHETFELTNTESVAPIELVAPLEPTETNPVDPPEVQKRIPLYKHKEYLENGQVVIVLNPKKPSLSTDEDITTSEDEI